MATAGEIRWLKMIRKLECVVCRRCGLQQQTPTEAHHVAEGSGKRSDFATVPLCSEHHRGPAGLHGMGTKAFVRLYRPPLDHEFGLMVWTAQDLEAALWAAGTKIRRAA